jgi:hypothetical protein
LKPVFEIIPEAIFFQQTNLICELSPGSFSYIFENDTDKKFHGLSVFHFTDGDVAGQLKQIFDQQSLLHKNYKKVCVSYSGEESALLPEELYQAGENELLLNTLYGDMHEAAVATDLVAEKRIYNVYRMPPGIRQVIVDRFPLAAFSHQYSLLIKQQLTGNLLRIIFYRENFVAILIRAGELQLIHSYPYHSGADVAYHLLNICSQFSTGKISLQVGGMIEEHSDLHKEIAHYFPDISFDELPAGYQFAGSLTELPAHYFSHLFSLALCV